MSGEPERDEADDASDGVERWIFPYFEDSSLWPVLLVVIAALAAFLTPVLLYAVAYRDLRAILATGLVLFVTARAIRWEWRLRGRPGGVGVSLLAVWMLAIVALVYGARTGFL